MSRGAASKAAAPAGCGDTPPACCAEAGASASQRWHDWGAAAWAALAAHRKLRRAGSASSGLMVFQAFSASRLLGLHVGLPGAQPCLSQGSRMSTSPPASRATFHTMLPLRQKGQEALKVGGQARPSKAGGQRGGGQQYRSDRQTLGMAVHQRHRQRAAPDLQPQVGLDRLAQALAGVASPGAQLCVAEAEGRQDHELVQLQGAGVCGAREEAHSDTTCAGQVAPPLLPTPENASGTLALVPKLVGVLGLSSRLFTARHPVQGRGKQRRRPCSGRMHIAASTGERCNSSGAALPMSTFWLGICRRVGEQRRIN